jgi:hypothetical protein
MLDPKKIEHLRGTVSLAFQPGKKQARGGEGD